VYDSGQQHGATAAQRRRRMTSGEAPGTPALQLHLSSHVRATVANARPGAADRAVAIASASRVVTAHLRYGQGIRAGLVCALL
jgi:hypothetical protein